MFLHLISNILFDYPANIFVFNVNNSSTIKRCSKLKIKTPERRHWRHSGIFIVNYEHIHTFFYCFYCWLRTGKYLLDSQISCLKLDVKTPSQYPKNSNDEVSVSLFFILNNSIKINRDNCSVTKYLFKVNKKDTKTTIMLILWLWIETFSVGSLWCIKKF